MGKVTHLADDLLESMIEQEYVKQNNRSCRVCKHFIRVSQRGDFSEIRRRGFCIFGQLLHFWAI